MSMLDVALGCIARGWHVFPCWPKTKKPMLSNGWHGASVDPEQIQAWWTRNPNANVAIACGPSNLCVVDIDHGLADAAAAETWVKGAGLPKTYTVRTGRRPEFGLQIYFEGAIPDIGQWEHLGCAGQVKSAGGYVMAAGSIHPSGEAYLALQDVDVVPDAGVVQDFSRPRIQAADGEPITQDRNVNLTSIAGRLRNAGISAAALELALLQTNEDRCQPPLDDDEVKRIAANVSRYKTESDPEITIGKAKEPRYTDWRQLFHTAEEAENAPPVTFCIEGFLQREGVTAIAAPVRNRKTLISLNVVHALLTGEALFGQFAVTQKPERVLYLVPESGLGPFTAKVRELGLLPFVGKTFFYRTLTAEGTVTLRDPLIIEAAKGAVVFLDTAVRFLEGDENSSNDIRIFAQTLFDLLKAGAEAVVMLHHTPKESGGNVMTLENALRGSGDIGAFLVACWGTRLQDPAKPYQSASFLDNLKQRDWESKAFEVMPVEGTCRMEYVEAEGEVKLTASMYKTNRDGMEDAAVALIKANTGLSGRELSDLLKENGITRKKDWCLKVKGELGLARGGKTS